MYKKRRATASIGIIFCTLVLLVLFAVPPPSLAQSNNNQLKYARSLERVGSYEAALNVYLQLFRKGNRSPLIIGGIEKSYRQLHRYKEMADFFSELIRYSPNLVFYKIKLGSALYLSDQKERALAMWQNVIQHKPQTLINYRLVASAMIEVRLYEQAIKVYRQALNKFPKEHSIYRELGMLYRAQLDYEQAVSNYLMYYLSDRRQKLYIRSQLMAMARDDQATGRIVTALRDFTNRHKPVDQGLSELLAEMYVRAKQFEQAFNLYKSLDKHFPRENYLSRFARQASQNGAHDFAILAYRNLLQKKFNRETTSALRYALAKEYYLAGKKAGNRQANSEKSQKLTHRAVTLLKSLVGEKSGTGVESLELLGDIYLNYYEDLDQAAVSYQRLLSVALNKKNQKERILLKLARTYFLKNDLNRARTFLLKVQSGPYRRQAQYHLAEYAYFSGHFRQAKKAFNKILHSSSPTDTLFNNVLSRLTEIESYAQDSLTLAHFCQAQLLEAQHRYAQAAAKYEELFRLKNDLSVSAVNHAVNLLMRLHKWEKALALVREWISVYPNDPELDQAYFLEGTIYEARNQAAQAIHSYQQILLLYPNSFHIEDARERARQLTLKMEQDKKREN